MASQLAQVLSGYRQTMPEAGSGLAKGLELGRMQRKRAQEQEVLQTEQDLAKAKIAEQKLDTYMNQNGPALWAALQKGPEGFAAAQESGFVDKSMTYDEAEGAVTGWIIKNNIKPTEVYDPASPTGSRNVMPWEAPGKPGRERQPLVSMGEQQTEESKKYGALLVSNYDEIRQRAQTAETALMQYEIARNIDLQESGPLTAWKASVGALAQAVGMDPETIGIDQMTVDNVYSYQGVMQNMVLSKMQAQKGPQTENDAKRIEATLATIGNPEETRKFLLDAGMEIERMAIKERDFYQNWRETHGTFDKADKAWADYRKKTPFVAKNPKTGRPVFFSQFVDAALAKNLAEGKDVDRNDIVELWQQKYGTR